MGTAVAVVQKRPAWRVWLVGCTGAFVVLSILLVIIGTLAGSPKGSTSAVTKVSPTPIAESPERSPSASAKSTVVPPVVAPLPTKAAQASAPLAAHITDSIYGHVVATTSPGSTCTADAILPSGRKSTAQGLQGNQVSGADGTVSWTYRITANTTKGTGTHTVTCTLNGQTASDSAPFTV